MKKLLFLLIGAVIILPAVAQQNDNEIKTIFGEIDSYGGYIAGTMNYSELEYNDTAMGNHNLIFVGMRGGWVIGHGFSMGIAGGGFFSDYQYNSHLGENVSIEGGYGGIYLEPIILPKFPVHIALPIVLGIGGATYSDNYFDDYGEDYDFLLAQDAFMIIEPGIELEFNLLRHVRFAVGATYRLTTPLLFDTDYTGIPQDILNTYSVGATLKLGKF